MKLNLCCAKTPILCFEEDKLMMAEILMRQMDNSQHAINPESKWKFYKLWEEHFTYIFGIVQFKITNIK